MFYFVDRITFWHNPYPQTMNYIIKCGFQNIQILLVTLSLSRLRLAKYYVYLTCILRITFCMSLSDSVTNLSHPSKIFQHNIFVFAKQKCLTKQIMRSYVWNDNSLRHVTSLQPMIALDSCLRWDINKMFFLYSEHTRQRDASSYIRLGTCILYFEDVRFKECFLV